MAGIEHRSIEGVLGAFDHFKQPNFAIFGGRNLNEPRDSYCEDNFETAKQKLGSWLEMIEQSYTGQTYMLKCYPEGQPSILNNTPYTHSTTFMLNQAIPVKQGPNGTFIIDRDASKQQHQGSALMMQQLAEEKKRNDELNERLHQLVMSQQEERFKNTIGSLSEKIEKLSEHKEPDKTSWDRLGEFAEKIIDKKPDILDRLFDIVDRWLSPDPEKVHHRHQAINGTEHKEETMEKEKEVKTEELTEEQQQAIRDAHSERQYKALDMLESKVGTEPVTLALEKLAAMSTTELQFIFSKLDIKV